MHTWKFSYYGKDVLIEANTIFDAMDNFRAMYKDVENVALREIEELLITKLSD